MASDSLWHQHAALFRRLYIEENKTLKQVKSEAEGAYGFPSSRQVTRSSKTIPMVNWLTDAAYPFTRRSYVKC